MHTSIVKRLRELVPSRPLTWSEARNIAERQSTVLLELLGQRKPEVNTDLIAELPRIEVKYEPHLNAGGISGFTHWSRGRWLVVINKDDSWTRRRFTLGHEFKHILDHPYIKDIYSGLGKSNADRHRITEQICDYFAACLLMPRNWVKQQWASGIQGTAALAAIFNVSEVAMSRRLRDLRLIEPTSHHINFKELSQPVRDYLRKAPGVQPDLCPLT